MDHIGTDQKTATDLPMRINQWAGATSHLFATVSLLPAAIIVGCGSLCDSWHESDGHRMGNGTEFDGCDDDDRGKNNASKYFGEHSFNLNAYLYQMPLSHNGKWRETQKDTMWPSKLP